jgi:hypothetical protein
MVAAKRPNPGDGNTQDGPACYAAAPLPSTAFRQRL